MMKVIGETVLLVVCVTLILVAIGFQFGSILKTNEIVFSMQKKQTVMQKQITNIEKWTVPVGEEIKDEVLLPQK